MNPYLLTCKFGEYICYSSRDIEFFLGVYFFGAPCMFSRRPSITWM